jgi:hypothetical protein
MFPVRSAYSMTHFSLLILRWSSVIQLPLAVMHPDDDRMVRLDMQFHTWAPMRLERTRQREDSVHLGAERLTEREHPSVLQ